jgi:hypothetical protein
MLEAGHGRMKAKVRVDLPYLLGRNPNGRTLLVIGIVAIRNNGIHPVVPTRELDHDKNAFRMRMG